MHKLLIPIMVLSLVSFGACGTKREEPAGEKSGALDGRKSERKAKQQAEDEALAKATIAKLQNADAAALIAALDDQDRRVRRAAVQLLSEREIKSAEAIQGLIPRLADHWKPVRQATMQALTAIGEPAVAPLIAALGADSPHGKLSYPEGKKGGKTRNIRTGIKNTLGTIGEPAVPALIKALESDDPLVRRNAIGALGRMGPNAKEAVPALIKALESDADDTVRMNAIGDLSRIAPLEPKLEPAARKAAESDNLRLVKTAKKALEAVEKAKSEGAKQPDEKPSTDTGK